MSRLSPYAEDTLEDAYAAWCGLVVGMQKARNPKWRKPSFKTWLKDHKARYEEYQAEIEADERAETIREAKGETTPDVLQLLAEALGLTGDAQDEDDEPEAEPEKPKRKTQTKPRKRPEDAARNSVLWRLNVEGLIEEALDASDGDYITQATGSAILTKHFGELKR